MAGPHPYRRNFASEFRTSIRRVQLMAMPNDPALRPYFAFPAPERDPGSYDPDELDETGVPWDLDQDPVDPLPDRRAPVTPLFSIVDEALNTEQAVAIADFDPARHVLFFLDTEYALIEGWSTMVMAGTEYVHDVDLAPRALYDVDLHFFKVKTVDVGRVVAP